MNTLPTLEQIEKLDWNFPTDDPNKPQTVRKVRGGGGADYKNPRSKVVNNIIFKLYLDNHGTWTLAHEKEIKQIELFPYTGLEEAKKIADRKIFEIISQKLKVKSEK